MWGLQKFAGFSWISQIFWFFREIYWNLLKPRAFTSVIASLLSKERCYLVFAIVQIGGKQYKVKEGDIIFVEKLAGEEGETVEFKDVFAVAQDSGFTVGTPTVAGASVSATVVKQGKDKKIYVMTYKAKKNQKRKLGHRQPHTKIQIQKISV